MGTFYLMAIVKTIQASRLSKSFHYPAHTRHAPLSQHFTIPSSHRLISIIPSFHHSIIPSFHHSIIHLCSTLDFISLLSIFSTSVCMSVDPLINLVVHTT